MLPAQQGLEPEYPPIPRIHHGLITQAQLIPVNGHPQFTFHAAAPFRDFVHAGMVVLEAIASLVLGMIHGNVRIPDQIINIAAILRESGDPDANRDIEFHALDVERAGYDLDELFGHDAGGLQKLFLGRKIGKQNDEFVSAGTGHGVRSAHATLQAFGNLLEQHVATGMPDTVIHVLETIQIQEQECNILPVARGMSDGLFQAVMEQQAIGQPGECVIMRQPVDILLGIPAFQFAADTVGKHVQHRSAPLGETHRPGIHHGNDADDLIGGVLQHRAEITLHAPVPQGGIIRVAIR